jgi:hypothetical protein
LFDFSFNYFVPLSFQTFAYDAVCYDATQGFVWISSTQLAIVFFAMMIVMLRVACYEIEDEESFQNQRRWCARLCCCASSTKEKDNDGLMKPLESTPASNNEPAQDEPPQDEKRSPKEDGSVGI